jgi:N-acylneuraminate cytidylyltransferase/CMP-N,N'-diacetyllegionaminic acid synthase
MIGGERVLAIVPARAGSKGLPGKNVRLLAGKPLLAWPVEAARAAASVDRVVVSTDSAEFADVARRYGADVPALRPAELASDTAPSSGFIIHMLDLLESQGERYGYFVLLEPTSPLTTGADVDAALAALAARRDVADALVSVTELVSAHPAFAVRRGADGRIGPYAAVDFTRLPRRQDIDPLYALDGSLYVSAVDAFRRELSFCHGRTMSMVMPHHKAFEVDSLVDFVCIEAILARQEEITAAG